MEFLQENGRVFVFGDNYASQAAKSYAKMRQGSK
jgi:hypothetical protein